MDWKGFTHNYNLRPRMPRARPIIQSRTRDDANNSSMLQSRTHDDSGSMPILQPRIEVDASSSQNQELSDQHDINMGVEIPLVVEEVAVRAGNETRDEPENESTRRRRRLKKYKCKRCQKKAKSRRKSLSRIQSGPSTSNTATADGSLDDVKCAICLDTVKDRRMKYIRCGHGFHRKCFIKWLKVKNVCPVCRARTGLNPNFPSIKTSRPDLYDTTPISDIIFFFTLSYQ